MFKNLIPWVKKHRWTVLPPLIFLVLILIAYSAVFNAPFLIDDKAGIEKNLLIRDFGTLFSPPRLFFSSLPYYIAYKVGGLVPVYYRFFNLLFHFGVVTCLYFIIKRLVNERAALIAAALFAIHPILVESVTWISAHAYPQYSLFVLFSILTYIWGRESRRWYYVSIFSAFLAILSAEKAVALPVLLLLVEFCFFNIRKNWKKVIPHFIAVLSLGLLDLFSIGSRAAAFEKTYYIARQFYNPIEHIPYAITYYLQLILFPEDLTVYHSELAINIVEFLIRWLFFIVIVVSIIAMHKKSRVYAFGASFFVIGVAPTLIPLSIVWVVAERYVYLGTAGVLIVLGYVLSKLIEFKKYQTVTYAAIAMLFIMLLGRTLIRNLDWTSNESLWLSTVQVSPNSSNGHNNMGDVYAQRGDYANAAVEFKRSTELQPGDADPRHNLGIALTVLQRYPEAVEAYRGALQIDPTLYRSHQNLGVVYYQLKQYELAEDHLSKALQYGPPNPALEKLLQQIKTQGLQ